MEIKVKRSGPLQARTPCLVLGVFEGKGRTERLRELDEKLDGALGRAWREKEFTGRFKESLLLHAGKRMPAARVLLLGLGKEKEATAERLRQAAAQLARSLQERRITELATDLLTLPWKVRETREQAQALTEGLLLAAYRFDRYRTEKRDQLPLPLESLTLLVETSAMIGPAEQGTTDGRIVSEAVALARDLVNEPGNVKSPEYLAGRAREVAVEAGIDCRVLEREELEKEGMGALLGVAQGSVRDPRLIVLEYAGSQGRPVALIGKGVVFDAGGISLKPAEKMEEMKMDMAGGAVVIAALVAAARLKLPVNLVGLVPAVENLPSGSAIRPGDVLTSLSGRSIEVINTDAEGRLILADALTYVRRFEPRAVIDLATLTGACIIALGHHATAVLGSHDGLVSRLIKAGEATGERLWRLPLWDDYAAQLKSEVADLKNVGGRPAGTITAAAFLQKFAEGLTWAHLDIAGTAWEEKGRHYLTKGATGVGVRLLLHYLKQASD